MTSPIVELRLALNRAQEELEGAQSSVGTARDRNDAARLGLVIATESSNRDAAATAIASSMQADDLLEQAAAKMALAREQIETLTRTL